MKEKIKKIWKKSIPYLVIAIVSIISLSIFINKDYIKGHDFYFHAASVEGMASRSYTDIFTGKIYGVVSNELGNGEGLFYPPLAHQGAAIIFKTINHFNIGGVYTAMRISYILILFLSGVFMRKLILLITKNEKAAMGAAIFYITFPYFLINIIVRSAMAEAALFIFMPIVLIGLYHLLHDNYRKFLLFFTIGCVGLIHSHLVMTLFFVILTIIGFLPIITKFFKKKRILYLLLSAAVTALVSLPFLLPMLEQKNHAAYHVFEEGFMANINGVEMWRIPPSEFFKMDGIVLNIPIIITFIGLVAVLYAFFRYHEVKTKENRAFLLYALILTVISFFCTTTLFSFRSLPDTALMIQFPWRLLAFVALGCSIIIGLIVAKFKDNNASSILIAIIAISGLVGIARVNSFASANLPVAYPVSELHQRSSEYIDYLPTSNPTNHQEHNYDFLNDYPQTPTTNKEDVAVSNVNHKVPDLNFDVSNVTEKTTITIPRIYYLGYNIEAQYEDGSKENLPYLMSEYGFIDFEVEKDAHINITYPGTKIQRVSFWVAGVTVVAFTGFCIFLYQKEKKKN